MKVDTASSFLTPESIEKIEKSFNAKYVCETPLKDTHGNWVNRPIAVFYQAEPDLEKHPEASCYFGIFFDYPAGVPPVLMIANAKSAVEGELTGVVTEDGETVVYSRYRHDYREFDGGFIDGGRDYTRYSGGKGMISLHIVDGELKVVPVETS